MTDNELIVQLKSVIGQNILDIHYSAAKYHYTNPTNYTKGDWTDYSPSSYVLDSPEWELKLSNDKSLFITIEQFNAEKKTENLSLNNRTTIIAEKVLTIPKNSIWNCILNKPITAFRLWKRVLKTSSFLEQEYNFKYQGNVQIIELFLSGQSLIITALNGDMGNLTFYPTGYFSNNVGVLIGKTICSSHTVYDLTMRVRQTYSFSP